MQTQVHGGDIYSRKYRYDFSANINPFGMPESVKQAAMEGVLKSIHYPDVQCRDLREAISQKESIPAEWIICSNGAAELIFSLVTALNPKTALLVAPGFAEYEQALLAVNCEIRSYQLKKENAFLMDEEYLDMLKQDVDIAFLCNPNNPTGLLIEPKILEKIILKCKENKIFLVLDECFLEFVSDELKNSRVFQVKDMPNLLILKAFTKMYGMPGLRLGYGICSDRKLLEGIRQKIQPWNVSLPAQYAGIAACKEEAFAVKTRDYIFGEREYLKTQLERFGFQVYASCANYLFFEAPDDMDELCAREGILIRDCSNYHGLSKGYYRIAVKTREENEELVKVLEKYYG